MDMTSGTNTVRLLQCPNSRARPECLEMVPVRPQQVEKNVRGDADVIVLDDSPPRKRPNVQCSGSSLVVDKARRKAVEKEHKSAKIVTRKDGSREQARTAVKSRELRPHGDVNSGRREKLSSRRDERVRKLKDGRTIITETLTFQKRTVL